MREIAESTVFSLESSITTYTSSLSDSNSVVLLWSLVVKWSISLPRDSVVVTNLLTVSGVVENESTVVSLTVEVDRVCVIDSVVVIFSSSTVGEGAMFCVVTMDELVSVVITIVSVVVCSIVIIGVVSAVAVEVCTCGYLTVRDSVVGS